MWWSGGTWDGSDGKLERCRWRLEWLIGVQSANSPMEESWKVDMVAPMCGMRSWSKGLGVPGVSAVYYPTVAWGVSGVLSTILEVGLT